MLNVVEFVKKVRHIIDSKVAAYIFKRYPNFIKFLHRYIEFMDENYTIEALNFENNISADTAYSRFLDEMWNQYCVLMFDRNEFEFSDDAEGEAAKRTFLSLSKFIYQNKGKAFSFDIILRYLTKFSKNGGATVTDGIDYELIENETFWHSKVSEVLGRLVPFDKPYTYSISIDDEDRRIIQTLIEAYTPVGFWMIWLYSLVFDDTITLTSMSDSLIQIPVMHFEDELDESSFTETLELNEVFNINEYYRALNYYDGVVDYNGVINYEAARGYALEEATITYHDTGNPDIVEVF